jgi:Cof subfamily protein (haloacid dehalogenase superfamily)
VNKKKLIAIDLDGTLFYPKKPISLVIKKNVLFVKAAIAAGHEVVFVTSRNHEFVQKVVAKIGAPIDIISRNGAKIVYKGDIIRDAFVDNDVIKTLVDDILDRYPKQLLSMDTNKQANVAFTESNQRWLLMFYKFYYFIQGNYREDYHLHNESFNQALTNEKIQRLLIYFGLSKSSKKLAHDESERLKKTYPMLEVSWIQALIEVSAKGVNKATAIQKILEINGMKDDDVMVVGDSGNDIPMFKAFKHSYCMSHAHPRVKQHAKNFIKHVYDLRKVLGLS